jgi:hypothetical protein
MNYNKRERLFMSYKRHLRDLRRDLVHAAGCTEHGCATRLDLREKVEDARRQGVRIPRSFRHFERMKFDGEEWDYWDYWVVSH